MMENTKENFIGQIASRCDSLCVGNGDFDLHTGFDGDRGDLLDDLGWGVEIDDTLVDPHLKSIPGLGTFTTRSLAGGDAKDFGRHTNGSLDLQFLLFGSLDQVGANLFEALDGAGGQSDADAMDGGLIGDGLTGILEGTLKKMRKKLKNDVLKGFLYLCLHVSK